MTRRTPLCLLGVLSITQAIDPNRQPPITYSGEKCSAPTSLGLVPDLRSQHGLARLEAIQIPLFRAGAPVIFHQRE